MGGSEGVQVIRAYCDESEDGKQRVYALAAYVGRDREWTRLSRAWRNRNLRDSVQCFHAADCEGGYGEFKALEKEERRQLKSDLIGIVNKSRVAGFAVGIYVEDYLSVRESSSKAKAFLHKSPYLLGFQSLITLASRFCPRNKRIVYIFEEQGEFSGRAKRLYDEVRRLNPELAPRMGSLHYAEKKKFAPLQVADNGAYEVMKHLLNERYDPTRPERISVGEIRKRFGALGVIDRHALEQMAESISFSSKA